MKYLYLLALMVVMAASQAMGASGHAVSVVWRYGPDAPEEGWGGYNYRGKIVRHNITNNQVVQDDTIFSELGTYPTLNISGDKVAFARWGCRVEGDALTGDCNTGWLSVMDSDGGNLTNLLSFDDAWEWSDAGYLCGDGALIEWPAGDWIYYEKPCKSNEIWKVKYNDASSNQFVVKYTGNVSARGVFYFRRWSISLDAKYAAGHFKDGTCGQNILHTWFPAEGNPCTTMPSEEWYTGSLPGCNLSISASGTYSARYGGGWHETVNVDYWDHATNRVDNSHWADPAWNPTLGMASSYIGRDIGVGAAYIRWSCNSDKWMSQAVGWYGHESTLRVGGNQLISNWVDQEFILGSNNPKLPVGSPGSYPLDNVTYLSSDAGDFWVQPPSGVSGAYEDTDGNWVPVDGATNAGRGARDGLVSSQGRFQVRVDGGAVVITTPGLSNISIIDSRGREVVSTGVSGVLTIGKGRLPHGAYLVRCATGGSVTTGRFVVSR